MATVTARLSYTVNLGDYNSAKVEIDISEIDPDEDVDAQIAKAATALDKVWKEVRTYMDEVALPEAMNKPAKR